MHLARLHGSSVRVLDEILSTWISWLEDRDASTGEDGQSRILPVRVLSRVPRRLAFVGNGAVRPPWNGTLGRLARGEAGLDHRR
jgi:hypothetical protein